VSSSHIEVHAISRVNLAFKQPSGIYNSSKSLLSPIVKAQRYYRQISFPKPIKSIGLWSYPIDIVNMVFCNYCQKPMSFNPLEPNKPVCRRCMRGPSHSQRALQARLDRENWDLENDLMVIAARADAHERAQRALDRSSPYVFKTPCRPGCPAVPGPGMFGVGSRRIEEVIHERWGWPPGAGAPPSGSQQPTVPQSSQHRGSAPADGASRTSRQIITAAQSSQHGGSAPADGASRRSEQVITAPQSNQPGGSAVAGESSRRSQHTIAAASSSNRSGTTRTVARNEKVGDWLSNVR
jgi:hypothetical protein